MLVSETINRRGEFVRNESVGLFVVIAAVVAVVFSGLGGYLAGAGESPAQSTKDGLAACVASIEYAGPVAWRAALYLDSLGRRSPVFRVGP